MNSKRADRRPFIELQPIPDTGLTVEVLRNQLLHWVQVISIAKAHDNDYIDSIVNDCTLLIWDKMIEGKVSNVFICDYKNYAITAMKRRFLTLYKSNHCRKNSVNTNYISIEDAYWDGEVEDIDNTLSIQEKMEMEEKYQLMYLAISCLSPERQEIVNSVLSGGTKARYVGKNWFTFRQIERDLAYIIKRINSGEQPDEIKKLTNVKINKTNGHSKSKKGRPITP